MSNTQAPEATMNMEGFDTAPAAAPQPTAQPPLDWLESWWPAFPFALGAYLFVRGIIDYTAERPVGTPEFNLGEDDSRIEY